MMREKKTTRRSQAKDKGNCNNYKGEKEVYVILSYYTKTKQLNFELLCKEFSVPRSKV